MTLPEYDDTPINTNNTDGYIPLHNNLTSRFLPSSCPRPLKIENDQSIMSYSC